MDEQLRQHANTLAQDIDELHELGFSGDDLRQQVKCLSERAFARAFASFEWDVAAAKREEADGDPEIGVGSLARDPALADAALPGEDETPIG